MLHQLCYLWCLSFLGVLSNNHIMVYAVSGCINVSGKVYEFDEESPYEFLITDEYTSTAEVGETYGKLSINGGITDTSEINGIASYGIESKSRQVLLQVVPVHP